MVKRGGGTVVICTGKAWSRGAEEQGKRKDSTCDGKKWSDDAKQRNGMVKSGEGKAETRYAAAKQGEALERQRGATEEQSCELHAKLWQGIDQRGNRSEK